VTSTDARQDTSASETSTTNPTETATETTTTETPEDNNTATTEPPEDTEADANEPNDDTNNATVVDRGETVEGTLAEGDQDFYVVDLGVNETITAEASGDVDAEVSTYFPDIQSYQNPVAGEDGVLGTAPFPVEPGEVIYNSTLDPGRSFVSVQLQDDAEDAGGSYTLTVLNASDDVRDSSRSTTTATATQTPTETPTETVTDAATATNTASREFFFECEEHDAWVNLHTISEDGSIYQVDNYEPYPLYLNLTVRYGTDEGTEQVTDSQLMRPEYEDEEGLDLPKYNGDRSSIEPTLDCRRA
jgi:hypothetical protein